ncbi:MULTISPECIES: ATP-grasp domain-containing protein [Streptomyces]|nr:MULTISPECIES: 30S ribosomal protein S6 modification protein RimK [Streptomyces]
MRLCFLVEEEYRHDGMPVEVIRRLRAWGHRVDVLRPGSALLRVSEEIRAGSHDAWVLKTVSGGPGLTLLEAAAAVGLTTVNDARAIRGVRDKALAAAIGRSSGLPVPMTYAVARSEALREIPAAEFPLVVKPADGSSGRAVRLVASPDLLDSGPLPAQLAADLAGGGMLIAQPYVPNSGVDMKVYGVGGELFATQRCSPLHPDRSVPERRVPLSADVAAIAAETGSVYGLDLFGVDLVLGPDGPVVVDVNDFPSFRQVPDAVARVAGAVLDLARAGSAPHPGSGPVPLLPLAGGGDGARPQPAATTGPHLASAPPHAARPSAAVPASVPTAVAGSAGVDPVVAPGAAAVTGAATVSRATGVTAVPVTAAGDAG